MIRNTGLENFIGRMEGAIRESGKMEDSMARGYIEGVMGLRRKVNGWMVKRLDGWRSEIKLIFLYA